MTISINQISRNILKAIFIVLILSQLKKPQGKTLYENKKTGGIFLLSSLRRSRFTFSLIFENKP